MRYRVLACLFLLIPVLCMAVTPSTLQVVDLRGIKGQPELETWLGSLQGIVNRQDSTTVVYLVRNNDDADLADAVTHMYHLQKEVMTPGALLEIMRPSLNGQVRYDPAKPWTRNVALTAAALSPGNVIATADDLGLPTVLDTRDRWSDRRSAYEWEIAQYGQAAAQGLFVLAPESGNLLADFITARKVLAVDLSPTDAGEATLLRTLLQRLPAGGRICGSLDDRCGTDEQNLWQLAQLSNGDRSTVPMRDSLNLSCLSRLPVTHSLLQFRENSDILDAQNSVVLIYDGGSDAVSGSQSLDYATSLLPQLMSDIASTHLCVGVEVPIALKEFAPAVYQILMAYQRKSSAEFVAAPNGDGWALPMLMTDAKPYIQRSGYQANSMDLLGLSLLDAGDQNAYIQLLVQLSTTGWRGALVHPVAAESLPDKQARTSSLLPRLASLVGVARVHTAAELRTILAGQQKPFQVIYLDPISLPPTELRSMLPEITGDHFLLTPSQAFRAVTEYAAVVPWLNAKRQQKGIRYPKREQPTLNVSTPSTTLATPTAADPIPVSVTIRGNVPVLVARLTYQAPDGRIGTVDLNDAGNGSWTGTIPPALSGGTVKVKARVVEQGGFGITISDPLTISIPSVDTDQDGADDTLEEYMGTDPYDWDSDHDGLADGYDEYPTIANRSMSPLAPPIYPPADTPYLTERGTSSATEEGRTIPAGTSVTYTLPLTDIPTAPAGLRITAEGMGTVSINDGDASSFVADKGFAANEFPISAAQMGSNELHVKLTAGTTPIHISAITLFNNLAGPYILSARLKPAYPPAGIPITVQASVYGPRQLRSVRLRYGNDSSHLTTVDMTLVGDTAGTVFRAEIPAQANGARLVYDVIAEDNDGNVTASPFASVPVGRPTKHSMAFLATRDITGKWDTTYLWPGSLGRSITDGTGEDTAYIRVRPGTYAVWLLAQPYERGIHVRIKQRDSLITKSRVLIDTDIAAGGKSGWYKLGTFSMDKLDGANVTITPIGASGYCAYGELLLTQDPQFTPPLTHTGFDWHNGIIVTGLQDGQTVNGILKIHLYLAGNIDAVTVEAEQKSATDGVLSTKSYALTKQRDGSYTLDTRGLNPGDYELTASGLRLTSEDGTTEPAPLISVTLRFTVPK